MAVRNKLGKFLASLSSFLLVALITLGLKNQNDAQKLAELAGNQVQDPPSDQIADATTDTQADPATLIQNALDSVRSNIASQPTTPQTTTEVVIPATVTVPTISKSSNSSSKSSSSSSKSSSSKKTTKSSG